MFTSNYKGLIALLLYCCLDCVTIECILITPGGIWFCKGLCVRVTMKFSTLQATEYSKIKWKITYI